MDKTIIVYWTGTGNTKMIAEKIQAGIGQADLFAVEDINSKDVLKYNKIILGCPAMGFENLEEEVFEPFFESIINKLGNKKIALFGSYGWGDGSWMINWEARVKETKAILYSESLTIYSTPNSEEENLAVEFGKKISEF